MTVTTDSQGRIYLPSALRDQYGERFHVVEYRDRIELIPIAEDPLAAVREEVGDALEGESVADLKAAARERAADQARDDVGAHGDGNGDE